MNRRMFMKLIGAAMVVPSLPASEVVATGATLTVGDDFECGCIDWTVSEVVKVGKTHLFMGERQPGKMGTLQLLKCIAEASGEQVKD